MIKLCAVLLLISFGNLAHAGQSELSTANPSIPELSQFEYMQGLWDVTIHVAQDDGSFQEADNRATVKAFYHQDGRSFQTIFSTTAGGFTTDIRTYNIQDGKWHVLFMNARAQRWHRFEAEMIDGAMQTFVKNGYSGSEAFDVKIIDIDVTEQSFTKEVFRRAEGEENWKKIYIMKYDRKSGFAFDADLF